MSRAERRRKEREQKGPAPRNHEQVAPIRLIVLAAFFALIGGFIEVLVIVYLRRLGLNVRLSDHFPWMIPAAHLLVFALAMLLLLGGRRIWRYAGTLPFSVGVLAGLMAYSVVVALEWLHPLAAPVVAAGVGVQAGRMARGRFGRLVTRAAAPTAATLGVVFLVVLVTSFVGPRRAEDRALGMLPPPGEGHPNILLIILDTVRARSMGLYDPALANTPALDRLAADGVVFDRAYAPSPWTLPSHGTMFTGHWPQAHGADWTRPLDDRYPVVAEHMAQAGYVTVGFVGNILWGGPEFGLARGFLHYESYPVNLGQIVLSASIGRELASLDGPRAWLGLDLPLNAVPAPEVTDNFLDWHADRPDRPYFAFLNYFDAHEPVSPAPGQPEFAPITHRTGLLSGSLAQFAVPPGASGQRLARAYRAGYEATIAEVDAQLGRLFDALERRGDLDSTVVVIAGDHGEVIGEHGIFGHNNSVYLPTLWVPLVIRYPDSVPAGLRVEADAGLRNLPATIVELAGVAADAPFPGRSLSRHWATAGEAAGPVDTIYSHLTATAAVPPWTPAARGPEMHSLIRDEHHYILNGDGTEELYEIESDRRETENLAGEPGAADLLEQLRTLISRFRAQPDTR